MMYITIFNKATLFVITGRLNYVEPEGLRAVDKSLKAKA